MRSSFNSRPAMSVLALWLLNPSLTFALPDTPHENTQQTRQERKAQRNSDSAKKGAGTTSTTALPADQRAASTSRLALPFKRVWQYLTDGTSTLSPSIDVSRIYLPLVGGRVLCLDRETAAVLWTAELGGMVTAPACVGDNSVYVATRKIAEDGSEAGGSLRAIDKATGLTLWAKDYSRPFASSLERSGDRIYAGSADGSFYAIDLKDGEVVWKVDTQDVVQGRALVTDQAIFFGSGDGALRAVEPSHGQLIWKYQTEGRIVGQPAHDDRGIYFGSGDGYVYAIDRSTGKLKWRSRTGAAVEASPVITGERILVASFDNFVYGLSRARGDRWWKRRLENRIISAPIAEGDASLIAPLRGNYIAVLLNSDGRRVNLFRLDKDSEIVADPIFADGTLVLATDKGLVLATATRPTETQTGKLKK